MSTLLKTSPTEVHDALAGDAIGAEVADHTSATVARLQQVAGEPGWGSLEWHNLSPRAAFSRRDARREGFASAVSAARAHGFQPFIRPVGGRLAAYHEGALVMDIYSRSSDPRPGTTRRFEIVSAALARGLRRLGVDAHVGEVHGEYCPGRWSVQAQHRTKIIGTGQRLTRSALLFTAVIVVGHADPLAAVMTDAYEALGYPFNPSTVGSIAQHVPGVTLAEVVEVLGDSLSTVLPLEGPDVVGGRRLLDPWDPR